MSGSYNKGFIYFICLVSAMGGLLFGYDWVVIGGAVKFYEQFFGLGGSPVLQGIATSAALVGCMVGAMTAGALSGEALRRAKATAARPSCMSSCTVRPKMTVRKLSSRIRSLPEVRSLPGIRNHNRINMIRTLATIPAHCR